MKRSTPGTVVLALLIVLISGCYADEGLRPLAGLTRVLLTDAPFPFGSMGRVEVYVVEIAASMERDTISERQEWVTIARPAKRFDLLALQQGHTALLGTGELPVGQYRAVRLTVDCAQSRVTFADGKEARVRWPAAGHLAMYAFVEGSMAVLGDGAEIVIDLDVGRSLAYGLGDPLHDFIFVPVIRAVNSAATGRLTGRVFGDADGDEIPESLGNASITIFAGNPAEPSYTWRVVATGHSDVEGRYTVAYLLAGSYVVQVDAPTTATLGSVTTANIVITAGEETTHSVTLPAFDGSGISIEGPHTVAVGDTITLHAVVRDALEARVTTPSVRWRSSNPEIAVVRDIGEYTAVRGIVAGNASIVATSLGLSDSIAVTVTLRNGT